MSDEIIRRALSLASSGWVAVNLLADGPKLKQAALDVLKEVQELKTSFAVSRTSSTEEPIATVARIHDLVLEETESFEFGRIGISLAYLLGAIAKGGKVDVRRRGARDPNFGRLYAILREGCQDDDPVWKYINLLEEE